jgi:hypothetical protein
MYRRPVWAAAAEARAARARNFMAVVGKGRSFDKLENYTGNPKEKKF